MTGRLRMCIVCRERFEQKSLKRLKCNEGRVVKYDNYGRSFYLCDNCIETETVSLIKRVHKICKNREFNGEKLKEILT